MPELERPIYDLPVERTVDTSTVVKGFVKDENVLFNAADALGNFVFNDFAEDIEYDASDDMAGYEGYYGELRSSRNKEEMAFRKGRIDEQNARAENFAASTGMQKALSMGALIGSDPTTLIPIGPVVYKTYRTGGRILEGAGKTAAVASAVETGREALLQYNQETRTLEESVVNIGAATFLSGLLGGAAAGLSSKQIGDLSKVLDEELVVPPDQLGSTVGAAQVTTTSFEEEIKGLKRTQALFKKVPGFAKGPVLEGMMSPSKFVRRFTEDLADVSILKNKHSNFKTDGPSVESHIKAYNELRVKYYNDRNASWDAYKARVRESKAAGGLSIDERIGSKKDGSMTFQEFREQAWFAGINEDTHAVPEVQALSRETRKIFDEVGRRSEEVGIFEDFDALDVKTAKSWMKRMPDVEKIEANRTDFKRIVLDDLIEKRAKAARELDELQAKGALDDVEVKARLSKLKFRADALNAELDDIAEQLIDRYTNATSGRLQYDMRMQPKSGFKRDPGLRGSAKARVWDIEDMKIADYIVKDIDAIIEAHLRTAAPDNELMAKFGTLDFDTVKKKIQEDYNIQRNKKVVGKDGVAKLPGDKELAKLGREMKKDVKNMKAMWDKTRGIYAQPDDYSAPQHVLERFALGFNYVRLLGDVVASSVPDAMRHVMVHGFNKSYGKLFKTLMQDIDGLKLAKAEMEEMGLALDLTMGMTALRRMNMDEYAPLTGKLDMGVKKASEVASFMSGINHWNAIQKTFAGVITQDRMLDAIIELSKGKKIGQKEIENLAGHGINKEMALRIGKQFSEFGEARKVLKIANARNWVDADAKNVFRMAIRKQVDEIIVTPGLDKPLWMSRAGWKTVGQFKTFSFASMQRVTLAGIQQGDAAALQGLISMTMLGSMVYAWKTKMAGRELSDDPRVWITEGVDRSGVSGWAFDLNNIIEKSTRGSVGVNALVGGPPMSRYASRNVTGALLGPSFGLAQDIFKITGAAATGEFSQSDVHAIRKMLPFSNVPYLKGLLNVLEERTNETLGTQ